MTQTLAPGATDAADLTAAATTMQAVALSLGAYSWSTGVVVGAGSSSALSPVQNVEIAGVVGGTSDSAWPISSGALITYTGAPTTGAMLDVEGPMRVALRNLTLNACYDADVGLDLKHAFHSVLADVNVLHAAKVGIRQSAYPAPAGVYTGASVTTLHRVNVSMVDAPGSYGFHLGANYAGGLDVSRGAYYDCAALMGDDPTGSNPSAAWVFSGCDNTVLVNSFGYLTGERRGIGALIKPALGAPCLPSEVLILGGVFLGGFGTDFSAETWRPDQNCGRGFHGWIHDGDMNDPNKNLWPESKNLGGHEGINLVTSTNVHLDRHQMESWRDGKMRYAVTTADRSASNSIATTTPTNACCFTIAPHQLRVFDRTPHANVYKMDRKFRLELSGALINPGAATLPFWVRGYYGTSLFFDSGAMQVAPSAFFRDIEFIARLFARGSETMQGGGAWCEVYKPASGGGATGQALDYKIGHQKGLLSPAVDSGVQQLLRVEITLSAGMTFNTLYTSLETL